MATLSEPVLMKSIWTSPSSKRNRIESIDILRGVVMIIMALDHVRDYFNRDAFLYEPTDLSQTSVVLFFTRFITHYCAPVFVFLAGISASLYGHKKSKRELSFYLFTRGIWLVFAELFIISLALTFNPTYPMVNLQVIWAIGISMIVLSVMIFMNRTFILLMAVLLIAGHNFLDKVNVSGKGFSAFMWCFLHKPGDFVFGRFTVFIHYPVIPWIGIIALGYYFGSLYGHGYEPEKRKRILLYVGSGSMALFFLFRSFNIYGDAARWSPQKNVLFTVLSFLNVTKYPPSLLYILITLGPAMIFLALAEKPLNTVTKKITVFGRVPFFYYVVHRFLIHLFAMIGAGISGYNLSDMILSTTINRATGLKGYGFNLLIAYIAWVALVIFLYPLCKWFDNYKRTYQSSRKWLSYV